MYDELVKALHEGAEFLECSTPGIKNSFAKMCHNAADAIEELIAKLNHADDQIERLVEAAEERRWIPVTERLPETPGEYMVAYHPCCWDIVLDEIEVGLDSFRGKTSWAKKKYQRVTHWMPLPEPPKEW